MPEVTDLLCTRCGLCCDGSLFDDVELAGRKEAVALEILGANVDEDDGELLLQPCTALCGTRCNIYPHRPEACRTFECRLLTRVRRGQIDIAGARQRIAVARREIAQVRRLAAMLARDEAPMPLKEVFIEALSHSDGDPAEAKLRAALESKMRAVEHRIREEFFEPGHRSRPSHDKAHGRVRR